jgi:NitT/TauT family transport system substrate-binding protein
MSTQHARQFSRRRFLKGLTLMGTAGLLGLRPAPVVAEPPPETTKITLYKYESLCIAPQYVAEELLRGEGFTEVHYVEGGAGDDLDKALASGEAHLSRNFVARVILHLDAGDPIVILGGVYVGCFELFGTDRVQTIRDLKGKTVAVPELGSSQHVFLASMVAYVGLDPGKDLQWVTHPPDEAIQLFAEGKVDAYVAFPPEPQELREKQIGHVVVNSSVDRPWSQSFCCMAVGTRSPPNGRCALS